MVCDPANNNINPPNFGPPPNIPPDGPAFALPKIPYPDLDIPLAGIPEDIIALVESLLARLPGGIIKPSLGNPDTDVWDAIAKLLNSIAPYLTLYSFFQALLEMILCIIDVLCALIKPARTIKAVRRLFKRCLPNFLALFPWLAIIAMIIALILLLLALIEYIINLLIAYIKDIIQNILDLAEAVQYSDAETALVIIRKISFLLCLFEQLFAILIAFQAIFAIIKSLLELAGRGFCMKQKRSDNDFECCPESDCPDFIGNYPDGVPGTSGHLVYYSKRYQNFSVGPTTQEFLLRPESWQFVDDNLTKEPKFADIITPISSSTDLYPFSDPSDGEIFWPEEKSFNKETPKQIVPYLVDLNLEVNPATFGHPDTKGLRKFQIRDAIVSIKPYLGILNEINSLESYNTTGTFKLLGGKVYEEDGTPYFVNSIQASIETFIHLDPEEGSASLDDGYNIFDIEYTWKSNHPALFDYRLITLFCVPELQIESAILNAGYDIRPAIEKIGDLPDIEGTVACLTQQLANFRKNVSIENAAVFQAGSVQCLEDLRNQALETYRRSLEAATDRYNSTVVLDPDLQFVNNPITVTVQLFDSAKVLLTGSMPVQSRDVIAQVLRGEVTLGNISQFSYDGYDSFVAEINSSNAGDGELKVYFDDVIFAQYMNREVDDISTSIEERIFTYTFVGAPVAAVPLEPKVRRDEGDAAGS